MADSIVAARKFQKDRKSAGLTRVEAKDLKTYDGSFDEAFAKANANGDKAFIWAGNGKPYNTNVYDWNARTKVQKSYANSREKLLGRKRWKTVPEDRFRTIGQFNPTTGQTRYFIEDREMTAENEQTFQNANLSGPTFMSSPKQLVRNNSGKIMSFDSPQAAKKFMKTQEFADYAGNLEVSTTRHKIPKRKRQQEGLQPIYRADLMGDNGMRDGQTRLWKDMRTNMYLLADENGDIQWFTTDPNAENEGWGTTPGSNGFVPVTNETDQFREAWGGYNENMNQASETAGESPYTRPDLYASYYPNPVAQDIRAGRDDFFNGAVSTGLELIRSPFGIADMAVTNVGRFLPGYQRKPYYWLYDDLYKKDFRNMEGSGLGDAFVDTALYGGDFPIIRKVGNVVGDAAMLGGLASAVPETEANPYIEAITPRMIDAGMKPIKFSRKIIGRTKNGNFIYGDVVEGTGNTLTHMNRGKVYNLGKTSPGGIGNGYSATSNIKFGTDYKDAYYLKPFGVMGHFFPRENYFEWMPRQYQQTFLNYYGGNPIPSTYVVTGGSPDYAGGPVVIGEQTPTGEVHIGSTSYEDIPEYNSNITVLPTMGTAPDNQVYPDYFGNMLPFIEKRRQGGRLGFPIFKNNKRIK